MLDLPKYELVLLKQVVSQVKKRFKLSLKLFLHSGVVQLTVLQIIQWLLLKRFRTCGSYEGRNIWFGVREFAMAAVNGIQPGFMVVQGVTVELSSYSSTI